MARHLSKVDGDDEEASRRWAANSKSHDWKNDPMGGVKGVCLITRQRMMGGVDAAMPDRIAMNEMLRRDRIP